MRLYLIRHGQSVNNALAEDGRDIERHYDPDLTDIGHQQAQHVAQFLAKAMDMPGKYAERFQLSHLYCSPMTRALQTCQPISETLGIKPEVWVDIHEVGGLFLADEEGQSRGFPGLTTTQMSEKFPGYVLPETITDTGWWDITKGLEHPPDFIGRAVRVALAIRERSHTDERIALVAHAAFLDLLIKALLSQIPTHPNELFYTHYNTAISRIDFGEGYQSATVQDRLRIHYLNRVDHLPENLWTW
jgi:2,3-bisphosphoglycerate-dependent phosphoglycerate mutase